MAWGIRKVDGKALNNQIREFNWSESWEIIRPIILMEGESQKFLEH